MCPDILNDSKQWSICRVADGEFDEWKVWTKSVDESEWRYGRDGVRIRFSREACDVENQLQ